MAIQTEPTRIQIPFADSGTKNTIPATNATPTASQAASWTDGFPAQCSLPLSAGGIPPARADFNGIFNTMSQSIRFGQEGGVWAWDATVDYGTNRLVLGSDGLLYWSIAQSGPNVGGAQDPTTDDGTYWGSVPINAPGLGDKSDKATTTEWVKDLAVAPVYLDPAGNDANDGMSAGNAVKTFSRALQIAEYLPQRQNVLVLAAGTYSDTLTADNRTCAVLLQGDVTISGGANIKNKSNFFIYGPSHKISFSSIVDINNDATLSCACDISITANSANNCLRAYENSKFILYGDLDIDSTNIAYSIVSSTYSSEIYVSGDIGVTGSGNPEGISVNQNSSLYCGGNLTASNCLSSGRAISVSAFSYLFIKGNCSIYSSSSDNALFVYFCSNVQFTNLSITNKANNGAVCSVGNSASVYVENFTVDVTTPCSQVVFVQYCGTMQVHNGLYISGTCNDTTIYVVWNSTFHLSSSATVSTNTLSGAGRKYYVGMCSSISVDWQGENRIPGTNAGMVVGNGYYG